MRKHCPARKLKVNYGILNKGVLLFVSILSFPVYCTIFIQVLILIRAQMCTHVGICYKIWKEQSTSLSTFAIICFNFIVLSGFQLNFIPGAYAKICEVYLILVCISSTQCPLYMTKYLQFSQKLFIIKRNGT